MKVFIEVQTREDEEEEEEVVEESEDEINVDDLEPDKNDNQIVFDFLMQFVITSESAFMDRIDLLLMLRACPYIHANNLDMIKKFKFWTLQAAIIAAQNEDKVVAFDFYDRKNAERTS